MSRLLDIAYFILGVLLLPYLVLRSLWEPEFWKVKVLPRLCYPPRRTSSKPCIWIHSVSVGEVLAVATFVEKLEEALPHYEVVISTTTSTGFAVAQQTFPEHMIFYYPLDGSWFIERAFQAIRPRAILLVELEIWPNLILLAHRKGIPTGIINGRITAHSQRNYRRLLFFFRPVFEKVKLYCVQSEEYARRFEELGVPRERLWVTGNLKFDNVFSGDAKALQREMVAELGLEEEEPVLVAGSTHDGEEEAILECYTKLRQSFPELRLILAPRHPQRCQDVVKLLSERGEKVVLRSGQRSTKKSPLEKGAILLIDTIGELSRIYAVATLVFVGGSLIPRGGHNVLEPATLGKPVVVGPHTFNFSKIVEFLASHDAIEVVHSREELCHTMEELLQNPQRAARLALNAKKALQLSSGAVDITVEKVLHLLQPSDSTPRGTLPERVH